MSLQNFSKLEWGAPPAHGRGIKNIARYFCVLGCLMFALLAADATANSAAICVRVSTDPDLSPKDNQLLSAIAQSDYESVTTLLEQGANPNARDVIGRSALSVALLRPGDPSNSAHANLLEVLWHYGASPFLADRWGRDSRDHSHASNLPWLQKKLGQTINLTSSDLQSMQEWVRDRDRESLCQAFDRYRRFSIKPDRPSMLLHQALSGNHPVDLPSLRLIAEGGELFQRRDAFGATPVHRTASLVDIRPLRIFSALGADLNQVDRFGASPVAIAVRRNNLPAVDYLLSQGADGTLADNSGQSPLWYAVDSNSPEIASRLLDSDISPNQQNRAGQTVLVRAVEQGSREMVQLLLGHNADPDGQDGQKRSALIVAARQGHFEIASLLLESNADASLHDPDGLTAFDHLQRHSGMFNELVDVLGEEEADLPDDQPIELALYDDDLKPLDPVYASDLDADADGGYLVAIDARIQSLVQIAQSQAEKTIGDLFDTDLATPQLDQQIAELQQSIAAQQEQYRQGLSRRARLKSERAQLARQIIDQHQMVDEAQRKRGKEVAQTLAALDAVSDHANRLRMQRQEIRSLQREVKKFDQDYSQLEGERFDNLREVEVLIESVSEDREIELENLAQQLAQQQRQLDAELTALRSELSEQQGHQNALQSEKRSLQYLRQLANTEFRQASQSLNFHLDHCQILENQSNNCHQPGCAYMQRRDKANQDLSLVKSRLSDVSKAIQAHRVQLEQLQGRVQQQERQLRQGFQVVIVDLQHQQSRVRQSYDNRLTQLALRREKLRLGYTATRAEMVGRFEMIAKQLVRQYGDQHQSVYAALARLKQGLTLKPQRDADALSGWLDIKRVAESYRDINQPVPPVIASLETVLDKLNLAWRAYGVGLWIELDAVEQSQQLEQRRKVLEQNSHQLETELHELEDKLHAQKLDLALLKDQRQNLRHNNETIEAVANALEERIQLYADLLREAYRPAAGRMLSGSQVRDREAALSATIQNELGQSLTNPMLDAIKTLPDASSVSGIKLYDYPELGPKSFVSLDQEQRRNLIGHWLGLIDFDAIEWRSAVNANPQKLLNNVFMSAMHQSAGFDKALFDGEIPHVFRLLTDRGSYWIQSDGSLLAFLERDHDALFNYQFKTPADSPQGMALRNAYKRLVEKAVAAFPTLPDANKNVITLVDAAFRVLDDRRFHHVKYQVFDVLLTIGDLAISATPTVGQYYTVLKAIYGQVSEPTGKKILENLYDLVLLWPERRFFAQIKRPFFDGYSDSLKREVAEELAKAVLFEHDKMVLKMMRTGENLGLSTLDHSMIIVRLLRHKLAFTEWISQNSDLPGPTQFSRWSTISLPVIIKVDKLSLVQIGTEKKPIYVDRFITGEQRKKMATCLGIPLFENPKSVIVSGKLIFGVSQSVNSDEQCMAFMLHDEPG